MAKLTGTWKTVADEIDAVLKKHNMSRQNFRVSTDTIGGFRISITGNQHEEGKPLDPFASAKAAFNQYHQLVGFKKEWLGMSFEYGGKTFRLEGLNMSKRKNYVVLSRDDKSFIAPDLMVKNAIEFHEMKKSA